MNLLNEIITDFKEWRCQTFDDGTKMHSQRFSGKIHAKLRKNFKSSYNQLNLREKVTITVSCFANYTSVAVFSEP